MKRTDSVSMTLPANVMYTSIAVSAAKSCADSAGFAKEDTYRISLAMDEGLNHALEFGYGGPQETIETTISRTSLGLQITIQFHGLPLEIAQLPKYDPKRAVQCGDVTGISLLLIEKMLDKVSFSIQPGGRRTLSMEKYLPAKLAYEKTTPRETINLYENTDYTLRLASPDDAEAISRLAFQSHGAVLFSEYIYYPDRVREILHAQKMVSVVIETDDTHEIMGHGALVRRKTKSLVEELTFGFVDPRFRSKRGASRLAAFLEEDARKRSIYAIEAFAVTNHVHSQRAILSLGSKECGILIDTSPASHSWGKDSEADKRRIGNLIFVKYLDGFCGQTLYIPNHHRQMVERIYAHHGVSVSVGNTVTDAPPLSPESSIWTMSDIKEGWTAFGVKEYGVDAAAQIADRLKHACAQGIFSVHLALPLGDPLTRTMAATFEDMGFFFAGVGPDDEGNENIILQYITATTVDYESIHVHSEFANEIKEYIKTCDPRVKIA
ncbi:MULTISPECIES: GNAT family N-acetyltransferase [unclassified Pseudodesulfovibrio]|uniref:GNAT family N-acetyltransferase n=1 Tax=unclassified Pseudodesulfovibrio TaxID=2661612 RepID=UPI000FEBECA6|nr:MULTISPECIES: GNAT family N-acetyltransferase [unclassified Pseudodesulfovibrio]MCJ2164306.1 ATP-binding protein [Pseudodesulfovibrio sp. S3-i]RWU04517.1 GNAT family N-acetyltransferase [Pseudodesulfovibrio sp. S3]